jgi:ribonuclease III
MKNGHDDACVSGGEIDYGSLQVLQEKIGYTFSDLDLLRQAVTHPSCQPDTPEAVRSNNQRLEFLGDSVLSLVLSEQLFRRFSDLREGQLSRYRSNLVRGPVLSDLARQMRIGDHLQLGRGEVETGGRDRDNLLEDALEALLGAIFIDGGFNAAKSVALRWYADLEARLEEAEGVDNPKGRLQEAIQAEYPGEGPEYRTLSEEGPSHQRSFEVEVSFRNRPLARGRGASKKEAESRAANSALQQWTENSATQS